MTPRGYLLPIGYYTVYKEWHDDGGKGLAGVMLLHTVPYLSSLPTYLHIVRIVELVSITWSVPMTYTNSFSYMI